MDNRYNNALSGLTYGFNCLVYYSKGNQLYDCILSIHEEYINILHIIIAKKISYLLKLHEIYNITDNEYSTESKLKDFNIRNPPHTQNTTSYSTPSHSTASPSPSRPTSKSSSSASLLLCSSARLSYTMSASMSSTPSRLRP